MLVEDVRGLCHARGVVELDAEEAALENADLVDEEALVEVAEELEGHGAYVAVVDVEDVDQAQLRLLFVDLDDFDAVPIWLKREKIIWSEAFILFRNKGFRSSSSIVIYRKYYL